SLSLLTLASNFTWAETILVVSINSNIDMCFISFILTLSLWIPAFAGMTATNLYRFSLLRLFAYQHLSFLELFVLGCSWPLKDFLFVEATIFRVEVEAVVVVFGLHHLYLYCLFHL